MNNQLEKYGRWALITGASSGIGAEFAKQIAGEGINLVLVARREDRLEQLARKLVEQNGIEVRKVVVDLSDLDFLKKIENVTKDIEIGLLINSAGFSILNPFLDNDLSREVDMVHVNCRAPLMLAHRYGNKMRQAGKGGVIFVSSIAAWMPSPPWSNYAATKNYDAVIAECLHEEFKPYGIDVLALCPGGTETEFQSAAGADSRNAGFLVRLVVTEMQAEDVVRAGLRNLGRKVVVIPGYRNWWMATLSKFVPRRLIVRLTAFFLGKMKK